MNVKRVSVLPVCLAVLVLSSCGSDTTGEGTNTPASTAADNDWYQPAVMTSWQWQLSGSLNTSVDVGLYDVDLVETSIAEIQTLQSTGKKVICYFSGGSYEDYRDDADQFVSADLGNTLDGWPDERWLDVRSASIRPIMLARLDLAVEKGCDGVEPDNMDGYQNDSGFALSADDQLEYNRFIADAAHERHLAVGLKNDLDQVAALVDSFDFAVNEQCFEYDECDALTPFITAGKPVFNAEYLSDYAEGGSRYAAMCQQSLNLQFSTLVLPLDLDNAFRLSCL